MVISFWLKFYNLLLICCLKWTNGRGRREEIGKFVTLFLNTHIYILTHKRIHACMHACLLAYTLFIHSKSLFPVDTWKLVDGQSRKFHLQWKYSVRYKKETTISINSFNLVLYEIYFALFSINWLIRLPLKIYLKVLFVAMRWAYKNWC